MRSNSDVLFAKTYSWKWLFILKSCSRWTHSRSSNRRHKVKYICVWYSWRGNAIDFTACCRIVESTLKARCSVFSASCNEQVFSPKLWRKKIGTDLSCRFREKRKNCFNSDALQFWKNDVTEPKAKATLITS